MKVAGFIANRIAFSNTSGKSGRQKSFSRFIIKLSVAATIISVAVMIITISLANGFQQTISQKIFSFWGHIRIQEKQPDKVIISEETPIEGNDKLIAEIRKNPEVKSVNAFATKYAILKTKEGIEGVLVKGLDSSYNFNYLKQFITEGRPIRYPDSAYSKEIMVSSYTAERMKLKVNDSLIMYFIKAGENPRPRKISIAGIYRTGIEKYDNLIALGDLRLVQRLNNWEANQVGGYEVFLKDYKKIDTLNNKLYNISEFPATWDAISVKRISPDIFDWLGLMDMNRNVLIGFMIVVAVINLITCLIILVLERVRMIGILKALGATDWTVQQIFLRQTLIITVTGIVTGTILALALLWLQQSTGFIKLKEEAYYMSTAAVQIVWWQVLLICAGTFVISLLILLIPTLLVKRVQPVKAIQFR